MWQRNQFASRMLLRSAALVRVDMGVFAAQHGVVRTVQGLQTEYVRPGTVECEEDVNPCAKMFLEFAESRAREPVVSVSHNVSLVGPRNRLQNFWMHSGVIVTGKAASRLIGPSWHKKTM